MKKILLLTLFFLNFSYFCYSQDKREDKIKAIQIAYLTEQLQLTPDEAQKFWPVFNRYKDEVKQARVESHGNVVASNKKVVSIQEKYQVEFRKVFPDQKKVDKVLEVDQNFRDRLRKELDDRNKNAGNGKAPK